MLSYQHGFHAGNFADVHKHLILGLVLEYLVRKPGAMTVFDVYAGRGDYRLHSTEARKTGEAEQGILKLWGQRPWPAVAEGYQAALESNDSSARLQHYPGSPRLARHWLRPGDRHILCELHPAEFSALKAGFQREPGCEIHQRDALEALIALTPPTIRRGCVLIDPAYEVKDEYQRLGRVVKQALARWPEATWLVWYPLLNGSPHRQLLRALGGLGKRGQLRSEIQVRPAGAGMHGSGVLVMNPPWELKAQLEAARPWLALLGEGGDTHVDLETTS